MLHPPFEQLSESLGRNFSARPDVYASQQLDGSYKTIRKSITKRILNGHVRGDLTVGLYPLTPNGVSYGLFDIDYKGDQSQELVRALLKALDSVQLSGAVEPSGRKGYHVWIICKNWVNTGLLQGLLRRILSITTEETEPEKPVEIFPKQIGQVSLGSPTKLPWGIHQVTGKRTVFVDPGAFRPYSDWGLSFIDSLKPVNETLVKKAYSKLAESHPEGSTAPDN